MKGKTLLVLIVVISLVAGVACGAGVAIKNNNTTNNTSGELSGDNFIDDVLGVTSSGDDLESGEEEIVRWTPFTYSTIKAVYSTGWVAGRNDLRKAMITNICDNGFNAVVLDIKDEDGRLSYASNVQAAIDCKANAGMIRDIESVLKDFHDNGIYVIGRIVTFKDPTYAKSKTDIAYKTADGSIWKDSAGNCWPNPYNQASWDYPIELAKEAAMLGFDEIQFDYIRFPSSEGRVKNIAFGFESATYAKADMINGFLTKVMDEMSDYKVKISADVFGIITKRDGDFENIGQDYKAISRIVDVVCPMVYPSHYAYGEYKIAKPDLNPYGIITGALSDALERVSGETTTAEIRPYLQDFTASWLGKGNYQSYGTTAVRDQIRACNDLGISSFTLWDPSNKYCYDANFSE